MIIWLKLTTCRGTKGSCHTRITPTQVIDCKVLFITDSNLHRMKPEIMNNGTKVQKIFCPTIGDIEYIVNNNVVKKKPNIIYIQCGTNDIEGSDFETDTIDTRFKEIVKKMKYIIDDGEIVISSILPRTDHKDRVISMNNFLRKLPEFVNGVKFMSNTNINDRMLNDKKHLDNTGFQT